MKNYFEKLERRVQKYKTKYANRPRKAAFKLALWNSCCIFKKLTTSISAGSINNYAFPKRGDIGIFIKGGIGDILINMNYVHALNNYLKNSYKIDVYVSNVTNFKQIFEDTLQFDIYSADDFLQQDKYIALLEIMRFPKIIYVSPNAIESSRLKKLLMLYADFERDNSQIFSCMPNMDALANMYSIINSQHRLSQANLYNIFNINDEFIYKIPSKNEDTTLSNFSLNNIDYITINRGVDGNNVSAESTKLWEFESYCKLVKKIKEAYPKYKICQLGISLSRCRIIDNVDINLIGKTNLSDLKVLLKNSKLHIDTEGGMVHLRQAVGGGKSVVIFGPTNPKFYGYKDNINISTKNCPLHCEWANPFWQERCINKNIYHICMRSITPDYVFEKIKEANIL